MSEEIKTIQPKKLPQPVADKYELTGGHEAGKVMLPKGRGVIDLSSITLEQAAQLVESKLIPFLRPKSTGSSTPSANPNPVGKGPGQ